MRRLVLSTALVVSACGGDDAATSPDAPTVDAISPDAGGCRRTPAPADRPRKVVVSLPYTASGGQANNWGVWLLDQTGALTDTGARFAMGRATGGVVAFTPDGQVAIAPQSDGTLGVVRFDGSTPVVVHARFDGSFYAGEVVIAPDGASAIVVDGNWPGNGGGLYRIDIGCDGTLTDRGRWLPTKLARGLHVVGDRAVLAATEVGATPAGHDLHLLDWTRDPPVVVAGVDAFGDDDAIVGGVAVTADGRVALLGDTSQFSGVPNRVAVVGIAGDSLTAHPVLTPIEDPYAIVASPFTDTAVIASGFDDALLGLRYAAGATPPVTLTGPLTYSGGRPQLPGDAVVLAQGPQRGLAIVAENTGLRRLRFAPNAITDLGKTPTGTGTAAIPGALGVEP
jgi:hypothetical protein